MSARRPTSVLEQPAAVESAVDQAIEEMSKEAKIFQTLRSKSQDIDMLRASGMPEDHIAERLAVALNTPAATILSFLRNGTPSALGATETPSYRVDPESANYLFGADDKAPKSPVDPKSRNSRRARVPAHEIRSAIEQVMASNNLQSFRLSDEKMVKQILAKVPDLKGLQKHERNRKIIDACAGRKHGVSIQSVDGQREITIAD
jgi:hypothetical protein